MDRYVVKNHDPQASKVIFTFVPNKQFGKLINISAHLLIMLNTINTEFLFTDVWFYHQSSKLLEIEDNVNMAFVVA